MTDWMKRHMEQAHFYASWSKDPSTKVGAVIVDSDHRLVGQGYNGFPRGVDDREERYLDKETKYRFIVHAEANAILNSVSSVRQHTLYATKFPCTECAKLIIQSGIARVVAPAPGDFSSKWGEEARLSKIMFKEACVFVKEI